MMPRDYDEEDEKEERACHVLVVMFMDLTDPHDMVMLTLLW